MKRRGRPPKITGKVITDKPVTGKKRGRPPKITGKDISGKSVTGKKVIGNKKTDKYISSNEITDKEAVDKDSKVSNLPLTPEQLEARREKVRATIPKIDLHRTREFINITKDKDVCREHTSFSCHRPDIYLDYGCIECSLQKACACPLKDINRKPDGRVPKIKKFVIKPKIST
jgi:hypothetical protein